MKQIDMRYLFLYGFVAIMLSYIVGCKTDKTTDSKTIEVVEVVDSIQSIPCEISQWQKEPGLHKMDYHPK